MKKIIQNPATGIFILLFFIASGTKKNNDCQHTGKQACSQAPAVKISRAAINDVQDYNYNSASQIDLNYPFY